MKANSKLVVPLATMAVAAAVTIGSGATWTAQEPTTTTVAAGALRMGVSGASLAISGMKPGDVRVGTLTISNTGTVDARLRVTQTDLTNTFFETDPDGDAATDGDSDLDLTITHGSSQVYSGDFDDWAEGATGVSLGELEAETTADDSDIATLTFTVTLSEAADALSQDSTAGATYTFVTTPTAGTSVNLPFSD